MSRDKSGKLYNTLTKSIICLPDFRPRGQTYYFSSLPNSLDCIVVAISFFPEAISLTRPGMSEWIEISAYDGLRYICICFCLVIFWIKNFF